MGRWLSPVKTGRALWERLYDRTTADHGNLVLNERRLTPSHDLRQWNLSSCSLGEKAGCWFRQEWDRPEAQPQLSLSVMLTNSTRSTKLGRARRNGLAESWAKGGRARARPTGPLFDLQLIGDAACKMQSALRGRLGGNCPAPGIWVEDREENVIYDSQQSPVGPTAVGCCRSRVRNIALEREGGIHLDSGQVDDAPALATHARTHGMRWPCLVAENARPTFGGRQVGLQCHDNGLLPLVDGALQELSASNCGFERGAAFCGCRQSITSRSQPNALEAKKRGRGLERRRTPSSHPTKWPTHARRSAMPPDSWRGGSMKRREAWRADRDGGAHGVRKGAASGLSDRLAAHGDCEGGGQERRQAVRPRASQPCTVPPSLAQGGEQQQQRRRRQLEQVVLRSRFGPFSLVQGGDGQAERAETRSSASKARRRGGRNPGRGMRLAESPQSKRAFATYSPPWFPPLGCGGGVCLLAPVPWLVGRLPCCVPLSYCNLGVGTSTTRRLGCPTLTPMPTPPEQASVSEGPRPADVNLTEVPLCVPSQAVRTLILAASPVLHHTSLNLRALSSRFLLHPHPATSTRTLERGLHPRHCLDANTVKSGFLVRGPCALATSNGASHSHLSFPGLGFPKKRRRTTTTRTTVTDTKQGLAPYQVRSTSTDSTRDPPARSCYSVPPPRSRRAPRCCCSSLIKCLPSPRRGTIAPHPRLLAPQAQKRTAIPAAKTGAPDPAYSIIARQKKRGGFLTTASAAARDSVTTNFGVCPPRPLRNRQSLTTYDKPYFHWSAR
ncbi:hypothetical protein ACCO45_005930 [Purpureocillium lilacinum]|uniref:Uncharacterized protein n=1 Tax=Purpureocillium lilacinum TaxID=33203 RepID=A0ACC4DXR6_PURLI